MASFERRVEELEAAAGRNDGSAGFIIRFAGKDDSGGFVDHDGKPLLYDTGAVYVGWSPEDIERLKSDSLKSKEGKA